MLDNHYRRINYLRVSVTDRCNFRCVYCMPPQSKEWLKHEEILSYEEILRLISVFSREGISNIRITGGEPLARKDIVNFIAAVSALGVIKDISLTTNGSLLPPLAHALKAAGLNRVNISLDTVNPAHFARITACGRLEDTLQGVESAVEAGLTPVKLNVVLTDALAQSDIEYFIELVHKHPITVRFIEYMPIGNTNSGGPDIAAVKKMLCRDGRETLSPATVQGNGPAVYYKFAKAKGAFGFITPISNHFCSSCNRIRLTADGKLRPCLLSDREIDIRGPLRSGVDNDELAAIFRKAVRDKPEGHSLCRTSGYPAFERTMSQIGG